jgi:hypothetical protein
MTVLALLVFLTVFARSLDRHAEEFARIGVVLAVAVDAGICLARSVARIAANITNLKGE